MVTLESYEIDQTADDLIAILVCLVPAEAADAESLRAASEAAAAQCPSIRADIEKHYPIDAERKTRGAGAKLAIAHEMLKRLRGARNDYLREHGAYRAVAA